MFPLRSDNRHMGGKIQKSPLFAVLGAANSRNLVLDCLIYNGVLAVCTLVGLLFRSLGFSDATIISVYILGVLISAVLITNYISNFIVSFEAMIVFNFFFTQPLFTLHAYDAEYPVTFVVMLIVSYISCTIAARLKAIARQSDAMYARTKLLFDTASQLHKLSGYDEILFTTGAQLTKLMNKQVCLYDQSRGADTCLVFSPGKSSPEELPTDGKSLPAVKRVFMTGSEAGSGTDEFPANPMRFLPVSSHDRVYAVAAYSAEDESDDRTGQFDRGLIVSVLGECSMALEKERIQREKEEEVLRRRNEKLRADLLRSISHDLRTPLTSISGNASNLLTSADTLDEATRRQLYQDIYDDSTWLSSLVENLLAVSRIEDGTMQLHAMPLVKLSQQGMRQVLINLVDNAIRHTPPGTTIRIQSENLRDCAKVSVSDDGPGIPDKEKDRVFAMFYSGSRKVTDSKRSLGLGLALCRSIVRAHECEIMLDDNLPHGCVFSFTLPIKEVTLHE